MILLAFVVGFVIGFVLFLVLYARDKTIVVLKDTETIILKTDLEKLVKAYQLVLKKIDPEMGNEE